MKEANGHTSPAILEGNPFLPLHDFYSALKLNNFLVTTQQIIDANRLINQYADAVKNEQELCNYLSPVFANSLEEQIQFKQIFDEFFTPKEIALSASIEKKAGTSHLKKHGWKYILLLFLIVASIIAIIYNAREQPPVPEMLFNYHVLNPDTTGKTGKNIQTTGIQVEARLQLKDSTEGFTITDRQINWGDNTAADTALSHLYTSEGRFNMTAYLTINYKNKYYYTDTIPMQDPVPVCFNPSAISIHAITGDSVKTGEEIKLTALISGKSRTVFIGLIRMTHYWETRRRLAP